MFLPFYSDLSPNIARSVISLWVNCTSPAVQVDKTAILQQWSPPVSFHAGKKQTMNCLFQAEKGAKWAETGNFTFSFTIHVV